MGEISELKQEIASLKAALAVKESELSRANNHLRSVERKYEESQADIQMLEELGRFLTSSLAIEQVIEHISQSFNVLDPEVFVVGLLNESQGVINVPLLIVENKRMAPVEVYLDDKSSPAVWCIENHQELIVLSPQDNARYFSPAQVEAKIGSQMGSIVYQPLMVGDEVVGCVSVQSTKPQAFNKEQLETIRTLSAYSSIAVANALGYQRLTQTLETLQNTQKQLVLREKMASVGTLTAGVAHEINNPVNFAHVGAENLSVDLQRFETFLMALAADDAEPDILESLRVHFMELSEHVVTIKNGTRRIRSIVQDLCAFTQIDANEKSMVDVNECIHSTLNLVRSQNAAVARFSTDLNYVPTIACFPAELNQVFMIIITNACEAIAESQKQLHSDEPGDIYINCHTKEQFVEIEFADNGCGMDEQTKKQIFEPFFTTKEVGKGTGLGMAIAFGIIKEHGGYIEVESSPMQGALVRVRLPIDGGEVAD